MMQKISNSMTNDWETADLLKLRASHVVRDMEAQLSILRAMHQVHR
jgi:hypothetical protein